MPVDKAFGAYATNRHAYQLLNDYKANIKKKKQITDLFNLSVQLWHH